MKQYSILWIALLLLWGVTGCKTTPEVKQAKYIFLFIGDGMGFNQVGAAEMFQAEMEGRIGVVPLVFTSFPVRNYATTFSATNAVTCSSAAGTALATGVKTRNNMMGMDKDSLRALESVAVKAKRAGKRVGITTNVTVNHATPAAFYAHQLSRSMYYEIGTDAAKAGFHFYGGSGLGSPTSGKNPGAPDLFTLLQDSGYMVTRGWEAWSRLNTLPEKMVLIQGEEAKSVTSMPPALGRGPGDMTLAQITEAAIRFLSRDPEKGFFLMVEGGMIDWLCHDNDGAAVVREVIDFSTSIELAYRFYLQHPDETLIIVTADHETGGMVLGTGSYRLSLKMLQHQKSPLTTITQKLQTVRKEEKYPGSWNTVKQVLKEDCGFWGEVSLSPEEEARLKTCYDELFRPQPAAKMTSNLYSTVDPLAKMAVEILNRKAGLSWASGGHSANVVPVYAVGVGAERFNGSLDNTDIPKRITAIGGYE